jgi:hypothetical protein
MKNLSILLMLGTLGLASCASSTEKEIKSDVSHVRPVQTREMLIERTRNILDDSPNLSEKQKDEFIGLHSDIATKVQKQNEEMKKLKVVLFNELTKKDFKEYKIKKITQKIRKVYNQRFDVMLQALDKAREILGKDAQNLYGQDWFQSHYRF